MQRKLAILTILGLVLASGLAFADRDRGRGRGHHKHRDRDRVIVRDHRSGPVVRDHRDHRPNRVVVRDRGPHRGHHHGRVKHVRVSGGRYVFPGGVVRVYRKPVIRERYYNRRVRPAIVVEHYDPVPGYVWVQGSWTWGGSEWVWTPGYWTAAVEPVYVAPPPPPEAHVQGGISVSAGISIR